MGGKDHSFLSRTPKTTGIQEAKLQKQKESKNKQKLLGHSPCERTLLLASSVRRCPRNHFAGM